VFVAETTAAVPPEAETREIPGVSSRFCSFPLLCMSSVPYSMLNYAAKMMLKYHQQRVFSTGCVFVAETTAAVPPEAETREILGMSSRFWLPTSMYVLSPVFYS